MTSYPKNEQFTNLKVNSEQDLFEINPIIPTDNDAILNAICNNECLPQDKFGNLFLRLAATGYQVFVNP